MKKRILKIVFLSAVLALILGATVHAGLSPIPKPETIPGPDLSDTGNVGDTRIFTDRILPNLAIGLIGFVGAASLVFLIVAGVRYATAFGEEEAAEKAKQQIINAILGLVVALLAYTIVSIVVNLNFGEQDQTTRIEESSTASDTTSTINNNQ